jgi:hypothetical protein
MYGDTEIEKKVRETLERKKIDAPGWEELVATHPSPWEMSPYAWAEDREASRSAYVGIVGKTCDQATFDVMEERRADMYGKRLGKFWVGTNEAGELCMMLIEEDVWRL